MKQFLTGSSLFFLFLFFLLSPSKSLSVCTGALILWSGSVIPSLLPAMILSRLLISTSFLFQCLKPFSFLFRRMLGLSPSGTYVMIIGYLCGYPMGVKTISDLYEERLLSREEGLYLAGFVNNVSPGFLITYICIQLLHDPAFIVPCLLILYGASFTFALLSAIFSEKHAHTSSYFSTDSAFFVPGQNSETSFFTLLDNTIQESILQILKIGGYILFFSLLSAMIDSVSFLPDLSKAICCSCLEITYGTSLLTALPCHDFLKKLFLILALSFGGLCSAFQSSSFLKKIGCSMQKYIKRKAMTTVIAVIYYLIYTHPIWMTFFFDVHL